MAHVEKSIFINAPIEKVFDYAAELCLFDAETRSPSEDSPGEARSFQYSNNP